MPDDIIRPTPPMTVQPPMEAETPPEPDESPPNLAAEVAEVDPAVPVSGEGVSQDSAEPADPPKAEAKPELTEREKLIADLTGVGVKPPEGDDGAESPATEQDKAPEQPEGTKPETAPEQDADLVELTNDSAKAMKPGEARRKINRLITRIKQAEPLAAMSKEIIETCEANSFAPDDYRAWVNIGIGIQQGNPQALAAFKQIADKAGITAGNSTAQIPEGFEAKLAEWEENIDVTPKVAKALRDMFKSAAKPPASTAAPVAPTPIPQPAAAPAGQPAPAPRPDARQIGYNRMLDVGARYKTKLGAAKWAEIQPALKVALKAKGDKSPEAWADVYEAEIEKIVATAPRPKVIQTGTRPGTQSGPTKPVFKSERERVIHEHTA